jgi:ATP-dependent Clp protease adaptor protein ClpS
MNTNTETLEDITVEVEDDIKELLNDLFGNMVKLVVHNDNNTFEWVIECFIKYLKHTPEQAQQCALIIHTKGKYSVREGSKEQLLPLKEALTTAGLNVTIEE